MLYYVRGFNSLILAACFWGSHEVIHWALCHWFCEILSQRLSQSLETEWHGVLVLLYNNEFSITVCPLKWRWFSISSSTQTRKLCWAHWNSPHPVWPHCLVLVNFAAELFLHLWEMPFTSQRLSCELSSSPQNYSKGGSVGGQNWRAEGSGTARCLVSLQNTLYLMSCYSVVFLLYLERLFSSKCLLILKNFFLSYLS